MPVITSFATLQPERSIVTLSRYCVQILHYPEWMFWGVRRAGDPDYQCNKYWMKWMRDMTARALWEAQSEIEAEAGFPIGVRWFVDEEQPYKLPLLAKWGEVVSGGVEGRTTIQADAAVTHNADVGGNPVDSTVSVATTVTDPDEIRVYYPASLSVEGPVEIDPSDIDISGGVATISIPRCRLVHPSFADNPAGGLDYAVAANFLSVVDVMRVFNDPSTHATLVWPHECGSSSGLCGCACSDYQMEGCIYVKSGELGILDVLPASYSGGVWSGASSCCRGEPAIALLNYQAGIGSTHRKWQQALDSIVRLAHTKMPEEACGCEVAQRLWGRDREQPDVFTRERLNCPFGLPNGAWTAWRFTQAIKQYRLGTSL